MAPKPNLVKTCAQINWAMHDKQEFIDIVEVVYRGARKGHGLVVSPKGAHDFPCNRGETVTSNRCTLDARACGAVVASAEQLLC